MSIKNLINFTKPIHILIQCYTNQYIKKKGDTGDGQDTGFEGDTAAILSAAY